MSFLLLQTFLFLLLLLLLLLFLLLLMLLLMLFVLGLTFFADDIPELVQVISGAAQFACAVLERHLRKPFSEVCDRRRRVDWSYGVPFFWKSPRGVRSSVAY